LPIEVVIPLNRHSIETSDQAIRLLRQSAVVSLDAVVFGVK
jgi:hypothetical protein